MNRPAKNPWYTRKKGSCGDRADVFKPLYKKRLQYSEFAYLAFLAKGL
jgi:hypothetical protein